MGFNKNKLLSLLFLLPFVLTSCNQDKSNIRYLTENDPGTATIRIYKNNNSTSKGRYIAPKNVEIEYTYNDLSGLLANNENVCPSIGDINLLVIPVHLPGGKFNTQEVKDDIQKAFFSKNDERIGFKSVSEYYYESSYGKLNFGGIVTDWFDVDEYTNVSDVSLITQGENGTIITEILQKAVYWAKSVQKIDLSKFDNNKDGSIDGVWLVYDYLDWPTQQALNLKENPYYDGSDLNSALWNFTAWDWLTAPNVDNPTTSAFSWASFNMMYTHYCVYDENDFPLLDNRNDILVGTHTYIHETGHLLGLDDYYASDDSTYHPLGHASMMDQNICDLDSYSKMILGWITPYVVYGTSEILIPTVTSSDKAVIVIPTNYDEISAKVERLVKGNKTESFKYKFNPFSEYIMIDLYSPDGLNEQDTYGEYINNREPGIAATGVRIYHVDSRIFKCRIVNYEFGTKMVYDEGYVWKGQKLNNDEAILMPISNQKIESSSFQLPEIFDYYDQIRLLEANQINTFSNGGIASKQTLFTPETEDFDIGKFGYQFFSANYAFNDGNELPFKINVKTLKEID